MTPTGRGGIPAPFTGHSATVLPGWIDENGHMNLAYYLVVLDGATDLLWDAIGLGAAYRERTGCGTFAVESHILYRAELLLHDQVHVSSQVLAVDARRIHLAHELRRAGTDGLVAQQELMLLHVDLGTRKVVSFEPEFAIHLAATLCNHLRMPRPDWVGRRVAMPPQA